MRHTQLMADARHKLSAEFRKRPELDSNPAAYKSKCQIRENVLAAIGPENASVLDLFAGSGAMWKAVWSKAGRYVACDERWFWDKRTSYVCDNRVLLRAIDLSPYNLVDLDAYGSPWDQIYILSRRRKIAKGERVGIVLTDGSSTKIKFGAMPLSMAALARVPADGAGVSKNCNAILEQTLAGLAKDMASRIVKRWEARGATGARVIYTGLVLEGVGP